MNTLKYIIFIAILLLLNTPSSFSQKKEITTEFHVEGVCGDCKQRIENAAYLKGVKFCEWNKETEILKIVYNPEKISIETIHQSIAQAGHDTEKVEADSVAYSKLPKCCAYKGDVHKH